MFVYTSRREKEKKKREARKRMGCGEHDGWSVALCVGAQENGLIDQVLAAITEASGKSKRGVRQIN